MQGPRINARERQQIRYPAVALRRHFFSEPAQRTAREDATALTAGEGRSFRSIKKKGSITRNFDEVLAAAAIVFSCLALQKRPDCRVRHTSSSSTWGGTRAAAAYCVRRLPPAHHGKRPVPRASEKKNSAFLTRGGVPPKRFA